MLILTPSKLSIILNIGIKYITLRLDLRKYQTADQKPQFELLYKFKEAYKVQDMTVQGGMTEFRNKLRDSP